MDFYEVVEKRRTVRDFEPEDMPDEVLERIIGIGRPQKNAQVPGQIDIDIKTRIHWNRF